MLSIMQDTDYHNKKSLIVEIEKKTGAKIAYTTLWNWEQKGYIKPDGFMPQGKRSVPVYTTKSVDQFIEKLIRLHAQGKVRLTKEV